MVWLVKNENKKEMANVKTCCDENYENVTTHKYLNVCTPSILLLQPLHCYETSLFFATLHWLNFKTESNYHCANFYRQLSAKTDPFHFIFRHTLFAERRYLWFFLSFKKTGRKNVTLWECEWIQFSSRQLDNKNDHSTTGTLQFKFAMRCD